MPGPDVPPTAKPTTRLPPERWPEIERLLDEALELPEAERTAFLDRACAGDLSLRDELRSLMAWIRDTGDSEAPRQHAMRVVPETNDLPEGHRVGAYRIEGLIGRGGMSEVYLATRSDGQYSQRVALKILSRELASKADRFLEERQLLAQLEHPGIARLLDGGLLDDGRPFMAMEFIEGDTITEHCARTGASLEPRLNLFLQVCEAVAYAHRNLVVHRDLKPSNILVTPKGEVKLLDFGIAKLLKPEAALGGDATRTLHLTPSYAAPEQLLGQAVTTATDTYALGVLLFELLCGEPPFQLSSLPLAVAMQQVLHDAPAAPSTTVQNSPKAPIPAKELRGDIDAIVGKALRKEPESRYASASELLADIERYRRYEPIAAREAALGYVLRRFARRHYAAVIAGGLTACALLLGLAVSLWFYADARRARNEALASATTTQAVNDFLGRDLLSGADPELGQTRDLTVKKLLDRAAAKVDERLHDQPEAQAQVDRALATSYYQLNFLPEARHYIEAAARIYDGLDGSMTQRKLDTLDYLVFVLTEQDQHRDALTKLDEILPAAENRWGERAPAVMKLRVQAAWARLATGQWERGAQDLRVIIADAERIEPPTWTTVADARWMLGTALMRLARFAEAEDVLRTNVVYRAQYQVGSPVLKAKDRMTLGVVLTQLARYYEADTELTSAYELVLNWQGRESQWLLSIRRYLADLRMQQGRLDEAENLLDEAFALESANVSADDSEAARIQAGLAEIYWRKGRREDAAATMKQAVAKMDRLEQTLGPDHPWTIQRRVQLADILRESGKHRDAWDALDGVSARAIARLPDRHPYLADLRRVQGLLWLGDRQFGKARSALQEALDIYKFRLGDNHWETRRARQELASVPPTAR